MHRFRDLLRERQIAGEGRDAQRAQGGLLPIRPPSWELAFSDARM